LALRLATVAQLWIERFLAGNKPEPPRNGTKDVAFTFARSLSAETSRFFASKHALYYYACFTTDEEDENRLEYGIRQTQRLSLGQVPTFGAEAIDRTPEHRVGIVVHVPKTLYE